MITRTKFRRFLRCMYAINFEFLSVAGLTSMKYMTGYSCHNLERFSWLLLLFLKDFREPFHDYKCEYLLNFRLY